VFVNYLIIVLLTYQKPLEGGPGRKLPEQKPIEDKATVLYIGRIPHGFYEKEMEGVISLLSNF
jgi:hypothetical protein